MLKSINVRVQPTIPYVDKFIQTTKEQEKGQWDEAGPLTSNLHFVL